MGTREDEDSLCQRQVREANVSKTWPKGQEGKPTGTRRVGRDRKSREHTLRAGAGGVNVWSGVKKSDLLRGKSCPGASSMWLEHEGSTCHLPDTRGQCRTGTRKQCCDDIQGQVSILSRKSQRQPGRCRAEATASKGRK